MAARTAASSLSLAGPGSLTSFSASTAKSVLDHYSTLPDARSKVTFTKTLYPQLHLLSISQPSTSISGCISFLHTLDQACTEPIPIVETFKSGFVTFLSSECYTFWQPVVTPDSERENRLPLTFYSAAMATGILVARLFACTPAFHDSSDELDNIWKNLVEPIIVRSLFVKQDTSSSAPGNVTLLPALLAASNKSIADYLVLRHKGKGTDYVWYDDECKKPDETWTWNDIVARFQRDAFNRTYQPKHTYPQETMEFWNQIVDRLANKAEDDLKDMHEEEVVRLFKPMQQQQQVEMHTEALQQQADVKQLATLLRETAQKVENKFSLGKEMSRQESYLALGAAGQQGAGQDGNELRETERKLKDVASKLLELL